MSRSVRHPDTLPNPQIAWRQLQEEAVHWVLLLALSAGIATILLTEVLRNPPHWNMLGIALILLAAGTKMLLRWGYLLGVGSLLGGSLALLAGVIVATAEPALLVLLILPVALAALLVNPQTALGMAALTTLFWGSNAGGVGFSLHQLPVLVVLWGSVLVLWVFLYLTGDAMAWSWQGYHRARRLLEEARQHRTELEEIRADLVQANQQLARMSKRLNAMVQIAEESRQAKEEFVANVSHELRTPLNMIIGFSEMITQAPRVYGTDLPQPLLADIATIQRNSQHLASLVNDVLDLSQAEAGRMSLAKRWVDLAAIVDAAVTGVQPLYQSKGLGLEVDLAPDLPSIFCDETRIRQVILNLFSNAGRFTERGGVEICARQDGGDVIVRVADTGPGIPAEKVEKVFEPFQQLDNSLRRRVDGTGLGLSISRQFVEMHGGSMWLESQVGTGTTVFVRLPISPASLEPTPDALRWVTPYHQPDARTRPSKAPVPVLAPRYVVLEPRDTLTKLLSHYLEGAELVSVTTAEEALAELARLPANALLINEPEFDEGVSGESWLNNLPYGTLALRCWVPGLDDVTRKLGIVDYLVKPVTHGEFLAAMEELGDAVETVLLVDDDPEALQLFGRMLAASPRGYRVSRASNGRRALELMRQRRPDAVVLDLVMPELDGFEVLRQKANDPALCAIPTIVLSSQDPVRTPIVSSTFVVTRGGGLSSKDLVGFLQAINQVLRWPAKSEAGTGRNGANGA